jgi:hypothetical protein
MCPRRLRPSHVEPSNGLSPILSDGFANRGITAMQQIKIFKGIENDLASLEAEVNAWLAESGIDVIQIFGNMAPQTSTAGSAATGLSHSDFPPSDVLLVVHYRKV